jgi:hypothetical protein
MVNYYVYTRLGSSSSESCKFWKHCISKGFQVFWYTLYIYTFSEIYKCSKFYTYRIFGFWTAVESPPIWMQENSWTLILGIMVFLLSLIDSNTGGWDSQRRNEGNTIKTCEWHCGMKKITDTLVLFCFLNWKESASPRIRKCELRNENLNKIFRRKIE